MEEKITDLCNLVETLINFYEDSGEIDLETIEQIQNLAGLMKYEAIISKQDSE